MHADSTSRRAVERLVASTAALILGGAILGQAASCSCGRAGDAKDRVFTERQFVTAAKATKNLGESCASGGKSDCLPQSDGAQVVCLHYGGGVDRARSWVCSRSCAPSSPQPGSAGCPAGGWNCMQVIPGSPESAVCAPPANFQPAAVAVRTTPSQAPRPIVNPLPSAGVAGSVDGGAP